MHEYWPTCSSEHYNCKTTTNRVISYRWRLDRLPAPDRDFIFTFSKPSLAYDGSVWKCPRFWRRVNTVMLDTSLPGTEWTQLVREVTLSLSGVGSLLRFDPVYRRKVSVVNHDWQRLEKITRFHVLWLKKIVHHWLVTRNSDDFQWQAQFRSIILV